MQKYLGPFGLHLFLISYFLLVVVLIFLNLFSFFMLFSEIFLMDLNFKSDLKNKLFIH